MKIGIVGFAGSGKTTLFNALTDRSAPTGYGGGKVNLGTIKVPDRRVDRLAQIDQPKKITYAEMVFADVPGGRGTNNLDPQTLGRIREMDALVQVVRGFHDGSTGPSPIEEIRSFGEELIISDMQVAEKRVERLAKDRTDPRQLALLERCLERLGEELPLRGFQMSSDDAHSLSGFAFVTLKPMMIVLNRPEHEASAQIPQELMSLAAEKGLEVMSLSGAIEVEIAALDLEDQAEFLEDLGLEEPARMRFIRTAFRLLDLITFLTRGADECRAWPIRRGTVALEAARTVHSDLARGFIRAEVIAFDDFDKLGSEAACRDAGKMRIEGKEYVVKDGEIFHVRFNV